MLTKESSALESDLYIYLFPAILSQYDQYILYIITIFPLETWETKYKPSQT